jgi:uncharacterized protein (TIGR00255 family)
VLLSMTGFGEARLQNEQWTVEAELRSVNNRHLKLVFRLGDTYAALEPELERMVRDTVRRGTVQVSLRVDRPRRPEDYRINTVALISYRDQLRACLADADLSVDPSALLALPGVVEERRPRETDPHGDWPQLRPVVAEALERFQRSRAEEGRAMGRELLHLGREFSQRLIEIERRGPEIVRAYRDRLLERVQNLIQDRGVTLEPKDLIREVAIFADRADISEELVRLKAHLEQYNELIESPESVGRKLEFVVQEMGREVNTIGSKANDAAISRIVVDLKGFLEKIRELIQNVE